MANRRGELHRGVGLGFGGMRPEEVSDGQVTQLVQASGLANVDVMRARTSGRLAEEVIVRRLEIRHEQIAERLQRTAVQLQRTDGPHGQLDVDDWFRRQPGHGRGPDVLDPYGDCAERCSETCGLALERARPGGIGRHDPDGGVECTTQVRVATS